MFRRDRCCTCNRISSPDMPLSCVPVSIYTISWSTRPRYGLDVWNPAKYVFLSCPGYVSHYMFYIGCANSGCQFARATNLCAVRLVFVVPPYGTSFISPNLVPRILRYLLDFLISVPPMPYAIFVRHDCTVVCFCTPGIIKWLVFAISDNAQNCVDVIAHGLQLPN